MLAQRECFDLTIKAIGDMIIGASLCTITIINIHVPHKSSSKSDKKKAFAG